MAAEISLSAMGLFMPILAFLLIFIVVYALLVKTKVLGNNKAVSLFISFILAGFFIVEASLVEFVRFTSAWFAVLIIGIFFLLAIIAFMPWDEPLKFLTKGNWFSWVVLGVAVGLFIISSAYVFNWVFNWGMVVDWFDTSWFGMILLLIIAIIVSFIIAKKSS